MSKKNFFTKAFAGTLATLMAVTPAVSVPVFAAADGRDFGQNSTVDTNNTATRLDLENSDIIDVSKTGSLSIYKYDITSAEAAGDYQRGTRDANGQKDSELEGIMADYAIQGVKFTYLRTGDIELYSYTVGGESHIEMVYEIPEKLAEILNLSADDAFDMTQKEVSDKCENEGVLHFTSTQISDALEAAYAQDDIGTKTKLENYVKEYGLQDSNEDEFTNTDGTTGVRAVDMPETNEKGYTHVEGLDLGLYLLVETEVPEQVTSTVNPWFVSLPFTNETGDDNIGEEGGNYWLYDMVCYPKNETGNPTLDKSVRNAYSATSAVDDHNKTVNPGEKYDYSQENQSGGLVVWNNDSNNPDNTEDTSDASYVANRGGYTTDGVNAGAGGAGYSYDFEYRDTNTASAGDVLDYIVVTRLPAITSTATMLSEFTLVDTLSEGLTYNKDAKIAFYDNAAAARANNTAQAIEQWDLNDPMYEDTYADVILSQDGSTGVETTNGAEQMTVRLLEAGLNFINGKGAGADYGMSEKYMVLYYTVTVNSDATLVIGDAGNPNDVVLTWSRTSEGYYNTLEDRNYIYSYSLDLTKEFSDEEGDMSQVEFKLYNKTDAYYVIAEQAADEPGVWYVTGKTTSKDEATTFVPTEDGKIVVYGVEADTYQMTEVATDDGYSLLKDAIEVVITPTDRDIKASVAGTTGMDQEDMQAIIDYYRGGIKNEDDQQVDESTDTIYNSQAARPAIETPNGRTIGKSDVFIGEIVPATATVDNIDATMKEHKYAPGNTQEQTSANATVVLNVVNNKNFLLPQTGGYGTILFTLAGCVAAVGGVVLVTKKSKKKEA